MYCSRIEANCNFADGLMLSPEDIGPTCEEGIEFSRDLGASTDCGIIMFPGLEILTADETDDGSGHA